jgi:hypothetical protein
MTTSIQDNKMAQGAAFATGVAGWFAVGYVASKAKNPAVTLGIMGGAFAASVVGATLSENKLVKRVSQGSIIGCAIEIIVAAAKILYKLVNEFMQKLTLPNNTKMISSNNTKMTSSISPITPPPIKIRTLRPKFTPIRVTPNMGMLN